MTIERIRLSCGHMSDQKLYGDMDSKLQRKAWLKKYGLCPECYKAKKEKQAKELEAKYGLPRLNGTLQQSIYASGIRADCVLLLIGAPDSDYADCYTDFLGTMAKLDPEEKDRVIERCLSGIRDKTQAKYWIGNKKYLPDILKDAYIHALDFEDLVTMV